MHRSTIRTAGYVSFALVYMFAATSAWGATATFTPVGPTAVLSGTDVVFDVTVSVVTLAEFNTADVLIGSNTATDIAFSYSAAWTSAFASATSPFFDTGLYAQDVLVGGFNPTPVGSSMFLGTVTLNTTGMSTGAHTVTIDNAVDGLSTLGLAGVPDTLSGIGAFTITGPGPGPMPAPFPHDRRKNRYISFDPNKTSNDGINVAFKVELTAITLGSCNGAAGDPAQIDFCRADRVPPTLDCNTCAGATAENSCINQPIDCGTNGTCTPTGETCVNDAPNSGGSNVGTVWWVGPEKNGVHLLVSMPFRKESTNWANPVHAGDCEIVPEARYGVRAVDVVGGSESAELPVETALFAPLSASWWGDCVGPLKKFCGGDIRTTVCIDDGDCTAPETCDRAWTLPDGSVNFDDVNAALALVAPGPTSVAPDTTWVDLHGNATGTPGSQNFDPPNFVLNFSDIGQILSGFGGFPYKGYDPADCPDLPDWP